MKKLFTKIFAKKQDKSLKEVLRTLSIVSSFSYMYEDDEVCFQPLQFGVTDIQTKTFNDHIVVYISLQRPGYLIGKSGHNITGLELKLTENLEKPVKIEIKEINFFKNIWN